MAFRIGIQLPEVERVVRWPEFRDLATCAEEVGFDSIWIGDHLLYRGDDRPERAPWEAWTQLAALAAVTRRVELGPLVACVAFHPPAVIAAMAASVDEISAGRLVLGLGAGWNRTEFDAFGVPFDRRVDRFELAFDAIEQLVHGRRVSVDHPLLRLDDAVLRPPSARPAGRPMPIMIGSNGPRMLRATLARADRWNTWFTDHGNDPDRFADLVTMVDAVAIGCGRRAGDVERSACVLVTTGDSRGERSIPNDVAPIHLPGDAGVAALASFAERGAHEVILVADPIDLGSVERLGGALPAIRHAADRVERRAS